MSLHIDTATRLCAVIGNPVGHSLSPAMHNAAFRALGLNYVYVAFQVRDVPGFLAGLRAMPGFRGVSVTIPHKTTAMLGLDEIDALARRVGCINTITNEDGRLCGTTTDGLGTLRAFAEAGVPLRGKRVLFLGTGGAVRSVAFAMADEAGVSQITLLGRTPAHVASLADDLRAHTAVDIAAGPLDDAPRAAESHDIVVQGTPLGMYPAAVGQTPLPAGALRPGLVVFDMVYRPLRTRLVEDAAAAGCKVISGVEMLVNQAALQFERWTGHAAPVETMRGAVLAELA